jgi:hypothetical protein
MVMTKVTLWNNTDLDAGGSVCVPAGPCPCFWPTGPIAR